MRTFAIGLLASVAVLSMAACVNVHGLHRADTGKGYVDGYYDDFYGPFDVGYWGRDGVFIYRGADRQFRRDVGRHFRSDGFDGSHSFHTPDGRKMNHGR